MILYKTITWSSGSGYDPYRSGAMQHFMRNAINLCLITIAAVYVPLIHDIVRSAPQGNDKCNSSRWWEKGLCAQLLAECQSKKLDKWTDYDSETTAGYCLDEYASSITSNRSGIASMLTTTTGHFLRLPFHMLFSEPQMEQFIHETARGAEKRPKTFRS